MARYKYLISRKEYKCAVCGETINKGIRYTKVWNFYNEYKVHTECYAKTPKSRWETSEYKGQVLDLIDEYNKNRDVDDLMSMLEDLLSSLEDKYDNMPYQLAEGSLVEERKDIVEETISNIEDLKYELESLEEPQEEDFETEEEYEEAFQEFEDKQEDLYSQIDDELYNIDI